MLQPNDELHGFRVERTEPLAEIDGDAIVMRHAQSGARLLYLKNEDTNKAFSIAFGTSPVDDTGVFHILEHSVLCGSDRFPVKEPFVNLLRTSMQTFLNALTFPDKTMYPVASTNEQDLLNLMDVYLDAVLHPAIYSDKAIFEQEGWHYELEPREDGTERLSYNGVVFNEMKGALSDPESVLYHAVNRALFPGTCYEFESGGTPRAIPQLTYEQFLDTHARHYRLDNSYIVLYGNVDIDRMLGFLDERYLSCCEPRTQEAPNPRGHADSRVSLDNVVKMTTSPDNACVGLAYVVGESHDFERVLACDILLDALMGGNESPIKRAVLDAGLGGDATGYLLDAQAQPGAMFVLRNAKPQVAQKFMEVIETEAKRLVEEGIPRDVLQASLAQMAFSLRERDRGMADGVALAMSALSGWLYSDDDVTTYLHYEEPLAHMREGLKGRYFEDLLESLVLRNDHKALVDLQATSEEGAAAEEAKELAEREQAMDEQDRAQVHADVEALRARQEAPDSPEALSTLPQLHVSDIGPAVPDPETVRRDDLPLPYLYHDIPTRGINYLYAYFGMNGLTWEDIPYAEVMAQLLGVLGTDTRSAAQVDVWTREHLGALRFFAEVHVNSKDPEDITPRFVVSASALSEELDSLASIPREVWERTDFNDKARVRDALVQKRIDMEQAFMGMGHTKAASRISSYLYTSGVLDEQLHGVDFYLFLKDLLDHFDERFDELVVRLNDVRKRVFTQTNCTISFTGTPQELDAFAAAAGTLGLPVGSQESMLQIPAPQVRREAFITPGDVVYVGKGANLRDVAPYGGAWSVLSNALSFDYLWNEVRVKGGAYGCGFRRMPIGYARFHSFRDPRIDETLERYDAAADWLAEFDPSDDEMEGYIVSTVAAHDAPTKPRMVARRGDACVFAHRAPDFREQMRAEKLAVTPEVLRGYADALRVLADSSAICVFGSADIIDKAKTKFDQRIELM